MVILSCQFRTVVLKLNKSKMRENDEVILVASIQITFLLPSTHKVHLAERQSSNYLSALAATLVLVRDNLIGWRMGSSHILVAGRMFGVLVDSEGNNNY